MHEAVEELIAAHGSDDVGDLVADAVAAGRIDRERGAALLNVAAWSGTDNGTALGRTLTGWLRAGDDAVRVHLALHHETFPFPTRGEMLARLPGLANRFAEHRALVERSLAGRPPRPAGAGPEVRVVLGEPTAQDTEAIVTVADEVPGCASGATVGRAAGPCRAQARAGAGCVADGAGWPVVTPAAGLSPRILHVIHFPGPVGVAEGVEALAARHRRAVATADRIGAHSVAIPPLGSGHPAREAAAAVVRALRDTATSVELVRLVTADPTTHAALAEAVLSDPHPRPRT
ncbi:macro domain-containing protein [Streptomyces sp. NPDC085614]|uniref:macro domain-containing protein n=1 Tax=Streptomyces sp. NPDC085614 TaxID=3365733 RepID=UPI0037CD6223